MGNANYVSLTFVCLFDSISSEVLLALMIRMWSVVCHCVFQPSECEQCTCDSDGIARCLVADCAPPPCINPVYQPGKCCPECKEGTLEKTVLDTAEETRTKSSAWFQHLLCCSFSSRSQLLRWWIPQSGDSCRRARLGRLLHQVSLSRRPGRRLLGGKPPRHLLPPQKLYARLAARPRTLIYAGSSSYLKIHIQLWLPSCTPHPLAQEWHAATL